MNRSSAITRRASIAANSLRTDVSPNPSKLAIFVSEALSRASSVKISAGSRISPLSKKKRDLLVAQPSMSKARRDTKCLRCSTRWNGQANSPVQRATFASSPEAVVSRVSGVFNSQRQRCGNTNGSLPSGRACPARTSTTCGITSPARWITTVSPMRMSLRRFRRHCAASRWTRRHRPRSPGAARHRRMRAGAPHLNVDGFQHRRRPLGRELVGRRPARAARHKPQPPLQLQVSTL
jgi:hypothetical protein